MQGNAVAGRDPSHYFAHVVTLLPSLQQLDGLAISAQDRFHAAQYLEELSANAGQGQIHEISLFLFTIIKEL
jgi:hypothetical protein